MTLPHAGSALLGRLWAALGGDPVDVRAVEQPRHPVPLPARTDVAALAWASVTAASLAAARLCDAHCVGPDAERIAVAYSSERHFRLDGDTPRAFAPLSGFFATSDGWVRTHGNYPHHARVLRTILGIAQDVPDDDLAAAAASALARRRGAEISGEIARAGGLCVLVRAEDPRADTRLRHGPLVARAGDAPHTDVGSSAADAPLRGVRVLDLTRVIAGPVATRTLALLGADVLRIDPPQLPEPEWQHLDSGHGKRSTLLDLGEATGRARFERLLESADVVITGYRARALESLGLDPGALIHRHPGLIVARLTAWGSDPATTDLRGFDSLVQASTGIAEIESADGARPGALPAQALDHSAGYLLAAGVLLARDRQRRVGGSWIIDLSLRRVAAELLGLPRTVDALPAASVTDVSAHLQDFEVDGHRLRTAAPAIAYDGSPTRFASPRPWGTDQPVWLTG